MVLDVPLRYIDFPSCSGTCIFGWDKKILLKIYYDLQEDFRVLFVKNILLRCWQKYISGILGMLRLNALDLALLNLTMKNIRGGIFNRPKLLWIKPTDNCGAAGYFSNQTPPNLQ